jgi:hypothetical protein
MKGGSKGGPMNEPCGCGGGCDCGCCEGTEPVTPGTIANRPGLDAIAYRVGTHSTFLETMAARLSSHDFPELGALTVRDGSDPSIALLDAWAVVADVLTFYQERVANEGYLRTATERRSVLELARLVGYAPRPGVASSVYLSYLLEEKFKPILPAGSPVTPVSASRDEPETVIPAGSRAQSVPGPGETQQSFETSEDLVARAAWNNLQVRLTQPQQPGVFLAHDWSRGPKTLPLYLKGVSTNLKPNDPLLIGQGDGTPSLFRILEVAPDGPKDRTRVEIEPWWKGEKKAQAPSPSGVSAGALNDILARASDLEALRIKAGPKANDVLALLEPLKAASEAGAAEPELRAGVEEVLLGLKKELQDAERIGAKRLAPWIAGVTAELEEALAAGTAGTEAFLEAISDGNARTTTNLLDPERGSKVLASLARQPAPQPRGGPVRSAGTLLAPGSDLSAKLLTVARPELRDVLYKAWANAPVVRASDLKVCALRTRASVFGHNAPLELIRRQRDGIITGSKEWDLRLPANTAGEAVEIQLRPGSDGNGFTMQVAVTLGGTKKTTEPLKQGNTATLLYANPEETVRVTLLQGVPGAGDSPFLVEIHFENRDLKATVAANQLADQPERLDISGIGQQRWTVTVEKNAAVIGIAAGLEPGESRVITVTGRIDGTGDPEQNGVVFLDNAYPQILPASWIVLERPDTNLGGTPLVIARANTVKEISRAAYGLSGKSMRIELSRPWLQFQGNTPDTFAVVRGTAVYAQCEELALAEVPIDQPVCGAALELAAMYDGLQPGRWLIVSGERADIGEFEKDDKGRSTVDAPIPGVPAAELVLLAGVSQDVGRPEPAKATPAAAPGGTGTPPPTPGERTHTTLTLAQPLAYCYKRDTITIYGNVAHATHGETRFEVLGSGDGGKALQSFTLKQPPLTWISAPTPSGIDSTLTVRVNDLRWHLAESLAGLGPTDRGYTLRTDDGGQTTVVFGNGERGARLPTGSENVRATYRSGIGKAGNVKAGQISQLATRPLGVKDVINPIPATGGADRESRDQARRNTPLAVLALDRLISVQDYEDFTRTFAGVGKASAARLSDGRVQLVHVTIAGEDDIPIGPYSDLLANLEDALRRFGDPRQPLRVERRQRTFLVVEAEVKLLPDYFWDAVEPKIRAAMLDAFSFQRRDLGQDALLSEVYATIQRVRGIDLVDVNLFARKNPEDLLAPLDLGDPPPPDPAIPVSRLRARLARVDGKGVIQPAQLLYLTPEVADTLILKERKS